MRRNGFELKMQERYSHFLAADSEAEMEEWVMTLKQALQNSTEACQERRNGGEFLDGALGETRESHFEKESNLDFFFYATLQIFGPRSM